MPVLVTASVGTNLGTFFGRAVEARPQRIPGRMTEPRLDRLSGHVLVLGHGDLTEVIVEELEGVEFLIVTPDAEWANALEDRPVDVLVADPSDVSALERARIDEARAVLVATNDDATDALAVLTARHLNPDVTIVAAATNRENVEKLRRAGADAVVSWAEIGGNLLVESAFGGDGSAADAAATAADGENGPVE